MKILFIDTETGGLDSNKHSLLSVGLVMYDNGEIKETEHLFIKQREYVVTPKAMSINKLNLENVASQGVHPVEAVGRIRSFAWRYFKDKPANLGGHNICFDVAFLKKLFKDTLGGFQETFSHRHIDTAVILKFLSDVGVFGKELHSLDDAIEYFGLTQDNRHSALGDALKTAIVYRELVKMIKKGG